MILTDWGSWLVQKDSMEPHRLTEAEVGQDRYGVVKAVLRTGWGA